MSIRSQKDSIFGQIAALKTLNDNFPKFNLGNSFSSINNKTNPINFFNRYSKKFSGL